MHARPRGGSNVALIASLALTMLVPPSALAHRGAPTEPAPSAADPRAEQLRDLYSRGQASFDAGSYATAIEIFQEAYGISKDPNLLFNISLCHDRLGNYDDAIATLDRFAAESPDADKADVARRRQSLEMRRERAAQAPTIAKDPKSVVGSEPAPPPTPARDRKTERLFSPAAWSLTAVSITGFAIGIAFGALSLARKNSADCADGDGETVCSNEGAQDARDSRRFAIVSDVSIAVGALTAVAVIAIVATRAARRQRSRAAAWTPMIGPRGAGLAWSARF